MAGPAITPLRAILKSIALADKRERKTFGSMATNNFFPVVAVFLGPAGAFLFLAGALVVLFPLSADPLRRIPAERLALWPISRAEHRKLRLLSPWINPMTWLLAALAVWAVKHTESMGALGLAAALVGVGFFLPAAFSGRDGGGPGFLRWIPGFPGAMGQLVRKNLREMLLTLDFYLALILSVSGTLYRVFVPQLPPEALMMMTILVVLAVSSYAQCLFGLESYGGRSRYSLMPLAGWRIVAAKDIAYLMVVVALTLPLAPMAGLAAGLAALAIGHQPSVMEPREQTRWRFSSGAGFGNGAWQVPALVGAAVTAYRISLTILIPCVLVCGATGWWYGRRLRLS